MADEATQQKEELVILLSQVESKAQNLEVLGQDITRAARLSSELALPLRDIVIQVPSDVMTPAQWGHQIEQWRAWNNVADRLQETRVVANSFVATTNANSTSTSGTISFSLPPTLMAEGLGGIEIAKTRISQALERYPFLDQARASLRRLGLDSRGGAYRTPLALLEESQGALELIGERGPASVLVPLRESIQGAIGELLRRRPRQEPAPKLCDKLISIGTQCSRPGFDRAYFGRLATDGDLLVTELSGAKKGELARQEISRIFHRGLSFMNALMESIDETRLKAA